MAADKPYSVPVIFDVVCTVKYGTTVEGFSGAQATATEYAVAKIMKQIDVTRDQIIKVDVYQRPVQVK